MDPERSQVTITGPAGIFKFMLDLVSDNEIDGLADLIPKLSSTCLQLQRFKRYRHAGLIEQLLLLGDLCITISLPYWGMEKDLTPGVSLSKSAQWLFLEDWKTPFLELGAI